MFDPDPAAYLPHRHPFLFIDRIAGLEPGEAATGEARMTAGPGPFPPVLLIEMIAEMGGLAAGQQCGAGGTLAAIESSSLPESVPAGTSLLVTARVVRSFGVLHRVEGEVRHNEDIIAVATLTLAVGGTP